MSDDSNTSNSPAAGLIYRPCVGLMVINPAGKVWIGRRPNVSDSPEGGGSWWQMPQGGIDPGETPIEAAKRELWEETGITTATILAEQPDWHTYDLPEYLHGKVWGGRYRGQRQKWFLIRFDGADADINITPDDADKVEFDLWRCCGRARRPLPLLDRWNLSTKRLSRSLHHVLRRQALPRSRMPRLAAQRRADRGACQRTLMSRALFAIRR